MDALRQLYKMVQLIIQAPKVILSELWVIWNSLYQDFSFYIYKKDLIKMS